MKKLLSVCVVTVGLLFSLPAFAQFQTEIPEGPIVKATLIAENDGIKAGEPFTVALRQEIMSEWHTYWSNPGDTGLATTLAWQLPEGFKASELIFPTPHRQKTGELVNFGYNDSVMILTEITPPATLKVGDTIELKGKANWLVCKETCIPESASLLLSLPVVEKPATSAWASAFTAVRKLLPAKHSSKQTVMLDTDHMTIGIDPLPLDADQIPEEAFFYPHDGLLIQHNAEQKLTLNGRQASLTIPKNKTRTDAVTKVTGDLWLRYASGEKSVQFEATPAPAVLVPVDAQKKTEQLVAIDPVKPVEETGFLAALLSALIGGLLLNLMPCVFPVLSLKALGLVQKSHHDNRRDVIMGGVAYACGVLATFTALAVFLIALKSSGQHIGWGIQLQSPVFVAAIALVLFFIGTLLIGAITVGSNVVGFGSKWTQGHGYLSSFFTGALAVVVATPCTAPFMGGAIFYGLTQPWFVTLIVLWALGIGLALPYVLLTIFPQALKFLPKPGIWMEHFKQFLAFPMWAAAIWLVWVLGQQTGATGVLYTLSSMLALAFGLWLWKTTQGRQKSLWQMKKKIVAIIAMIIAVLFVAHQPKSMQAMQKKEEAIEQGVNYEAYSPARFNELRGEGKPVFVNMTAAWCITCLANEKAALSRDAVKDFFAKNNITYLKGDWTNYDDAITQYLKEFGRSGVPIYVFYPADKTKAPVVLPQLLTPDTVIETLQPYVGD